MKKIKYAYAKRCIQSKNGFTLIEIIVALAIVSAVFSGIVMILLNSKKLEVQAKDLDQLNMIVASYIEEMRYSPDEAITSFELEYKGMVDDKEQYRKTMYLDSKMEKVRPGKATYKVDIELNSKKHKTGDSFLIPEIPLRYEDFKIYPGIKKYLLWVIPSVTGVDDQASGEYLHHNYEIVVINGINYSEFDDYLADWGAKISLGYQAYEKTIPSEYIRQAYSREESIGRQSIRLFREIMRVHDVTIPKDFAQYNVDEQVQDAINVRGSIPLKMWLDGELEDGSKYTVDIVNQNGASLDIYVIGDDAEKDVRLTAHEGISKTTYIEPENDTELQYDFKIKVYRMKNLDLLVDYDSGYYYAD
ncbi:type IV pilus modification PilV family protein [Fusibacter sp. JL216-2]|uniref:type IV pilus modification PilV family protein n=1 Tax=Fusibacter sp. JL216-2 TaxID=3071453 RepID=UPI003D334197